MSTDTAKHIGKKIERIRTLKGMKQDTLAGLLGVTQSTVSKLEQSEQIEEDKLEEIAKALGVTADTIRNYNDEATINIISNAFHDHSSAITNNFNPIEKLFELLEENRCLYESLLETERSKSKLLEQQLELLRKQ